MRTMEIGIGLPATHPGTPSWQLTEWARRADGHGFSTLGILDRLVYDNYEPLTTLAAAAAVTERIRLATSILIAPYRADVAVLAKQAATVQRLSEGRLVLGMAAGFREDDYGSNGTSARGRGARLDAMVERMRRIWAGAPEEGFEHPIGPLPESGPPRLMFGGHSEGALRRAGRHGWAWIAGGSTGKDYRANLAKARGVWSADGIAEDAEPRKVALLYTALGPDAERHAEEYLGRYYAFLGPQFARRVVGGALTDAAALRDTVAEYRESGCDELLLFPCAAGPDQVDLFAKAVL
ncbi:MULTISPECIES: LLM class flavin-dependent oxidoreductase [unclassified Streptomyces]|uniref:LLM class flavin-dependent oxidoreductase n=1 Tax=unclassified Streptomyces TaxID=2593676 RepID=UPI0035E29090